ncbi:MULTISPECIES: hypothetical protein [unclassified Cobetia]|uniref:hypothetical protein n=1 Tax=unclassified Cobetia TaxID=2609414 RepID=UPI00178CCCDD|nr:MULTISPECIES: hypothetical protein [unclassified Cobetia]MBE2170250.1 hypothetical protein [Cobetia sp. 2AS1]MDH2446964.1 hypothetical protein [Cobetia sp. 2AS]
MTRHQSRRRLKLHPDGPLYEVVDYLLRKSPEQIARTLKCMTPNDPRRQASYETIYNALYVTPLGSLEKGLIANLRQCIGKRWLRSRGTDRRNQIPLLLSIHMRPPEIEDWLMPSPLGKLSHQGANNSSAVGTLVERTTRMVIRAKVD